MSLQRYAIIDPKDSQVVNVIEYESQPATPIPGLDPTLIAVQSDIAGPGWTYENGQFIAPPVPTPPAPTPEELLEKCKNTAKGLLQQTDWVTLPDVTTGTPKLLNQTDFINYRSAVRALAVNPVTNPEWPTLPTEQWG